MSEGGDEDPDARLRRLEAELDRARHAVAALQRLAFALKELVPRAFEEGFRRRVPEREEPWLIDWLASESKRALEPLLPSTRIPRDPPGVHRDRDDPPE